MALWMVSPGNGTIRFGSKSREMITPTGCNEPFKNSFWCPGKKWFSKKPCPFTCRQECDNFRRMCGAI
jgi:hypothetical protein